MWKTPGSSLVLAFSCGLNCCEEKPDVVAKNFRVYTVIAGVPTELGSSTVDLIGDEWHTLEIRMSGDRFEGRIDGKQYLEVSDRSLDRAGAIGLWTKADAVTDFDDLELDLLR